MNRAKKNPDGTLVIEVDVDLDVKVTLVFERKDGPLVYRGALREYPLTDRVVRVVYAGNVPAIVISIAKDQAIDACAEFDKTPDTDRGT
jgi:hypothetical protein